MKCDLLIHRCTLLTPEFTIAEDQSVAIIGNLIAEIGPSQSIRQKYEAQKVLDGYGKLVMPGMVDSHIHVCQQLLRARTIDEWPMIWTRFLVPFESNLDPEDVYYSTQLACLEMIKSGTTGFIESGGVHMDRATDAVLESGMRATIARSTMDMGDFIPMCMKDSTSGCIEKTLELYKRYNGAGDDRIRIWFAMRQIMSCSPELIHNTAQEAAHLHTGVHAHLCEHRDEVRFCLEAYKKRPVEVLLDLELLAPNLLTAHNVALTEHDISLMCQANVKVVHCPSSNLSNHGFSKTPRLLEEGIPIGLGSDGASSSCLSLFDQMKFLRYGMTAYWGLPSFDPMVMPCDTLLKMATIGGAKAMQREQEIGALAPGKKADLITLKIAAPHLMPTANLVKTVVSAAGAGDVMDSVVNGQLVMEGRNVLTLDEDKIVSECRVRQKKIFERAGI